MAAHDKYPHAPEGRDRATFRHASSRRAQLTFQEELDQLSRKSIGELTARKELKKQDPASEEARTTSKLAPNFIPDRSRIKRKNHPIFHDELLPKEPRDKSPQAPAGTQYNALDRDQSMHKLVDVESKTKKFPFSKDDTVTVEDMKLPHVSSVGVVPSRSSEEVGGLKVRLQGQQAMQADQDPVIGPIERANTAQPEKAAAPDVVLASDRKDTPENLRMKPAIVATRGTIGSVPITERAKPAAKPRSRLKPPKSARINSAGSVGSSLHSVEIHIPHGKDGKNDDERSGGSNSSLRSVKDLLQEAKQLASPDDQAILKKRAVRDKDKETTSKSKHPVSAREKKKPQSLKSGRSGQSEVEDKGKSAERTVDEIIASLKDQSKGVGVTEADRRIHEIMQRVLSRTASVLGDVSEAKDGEMLEEADSVPVSPTVSAIPMHPGSTPLCAPIILTQSPSDDDITMEEDDTRDATERADTRITVERTDTRATTEGFEEDGSETVDLPALSRTVSEDGTFDAPAAIVEALEKLEERSESVGTGGEEAAQMVESLPKLDLQQLETVETVDLKQCYEDLHAPAEVKYEDILSLHAKPSALHARLAETVGSVEGIQPETRPPSASYLSTWQPLEGAATPKEATRGAENSVHHFCTMTEDVQLPDHLRGTWRRYHVPSKYEKKPLPGDDAPPNTLLSSTPASSKHSQLTLGSRNSPMTDLDRIQSAAARRIMEEAIPEEDFDDWKSRADEMFETSELSIEGQKVYPAPDHSLLFWKPAPPKWDVPPAKVKETLFPQYNGAALVAESEGTQVMFEDSSDSEEEEEIEEDGLAPEDRMARDRVLGRTHGSAHDLTVFMKCRMQYSDNVKVGRAPEVEQGMKSASQSLWTLTSAEESFTAPTSRTFSSRPPRIKVADMESVSQAGVSDISGVLPQAQLISFADLRARFSHAVVPTPSEISLDSSEEDVPIVFEKKRRHSAPGGLDRDPDEDTILVEEDFTAAMEEIHRQRQQMKDIKTGKKVMPVAAEDVDKEEDEFEVEDFDEKLPPTAGLPAIFTMQQKEDEPTPAELALEAGRAYVLLPQKKNKKKRRQLDVDIARIEAIQNFLSLEPATLTRAESTHDIRKDQPDAELRIPNRIRHRRTSVTDLTDFHTYIEKKGFRKLNTTEDPREFVRGIWNTWFDHVYPPTPAESDWEDEEEEEEEEEEGEDDKAKRKMSITSTVYSEGIDMDPVIDDDEDLENFELMAVEVERLTGLIDAADPPSAFHLARRGALLRKVGKMKSAQDDLDLAIKIEPMLIDAYWHRHLLFLLQNKKQNALDDLNFILKHNNRHAGAYRSRATIYRQSGDMTMGIVNFTQAIKLNPNDYEAYYQRAEMYEKRGEMLLAMEDYAMATRLMPSKTEALLKHGLHYFNNGNWQSAINDFTDLLKQDPQDGEARTYRGRAFAKMKHWNEAVEDLSAAVHLDPTNKLAFYHRGCILRKLHPKRALQDFSVSLMIDDSEENLLSFLHRGILYDEIGRHEDAIPDFESCLKLDKDMAVAHVNLGLIFMLKMDNYHRAIKKFTQAIKSDPTYVKAYVCRAEAYTKIHEIRSALLDFTRAIHLRPDVHHYYMYRGQLVLRMGNLELAAFCVRHAAELNAGLGQSATQQAIVQTFLKNYDKAISALEGATRVKPIAPLFVLLGKTQMKAQQWRLAVTSFERAIEIVKPWQPSEGLPLEAAEMYFLIGMCQVETRQFLNAHDAFNNSIRVDPKYADAYYHRGLTKMRLKQSKGIQDFNRALAINPKLFQAYLSRAAYYGLRGRFTKAILNCNEAIKLQPNSVRAYLYRGALKYHIRAYKLAIYDLSQAALIDNKCSLAYFNRAVCYQDSGHHYKALQDYGIVLLLGPYLNLKVLINRGLLYFDRKDYQNALHDFLMAVEFSPLDKKIHHTLGLCYHKLSRLQEGVKSFTQAIKIDPFFLDAYVGRGNVFMDYRNDIGQTMARRDYERALQFDPSCLPARVNLAYNLQVCGRYQLAWNQFTAAINLNSKFQPALEGRAIINLQMSDTFAAFQDISASVHVSPTAEVLTNRGVIQQFMGKRNNAMHDYQEALKLDPTYALAYFNAANVYFHMRQFKQALAYYHQALQYNPRDESALLNSAITKVMLKDSKGALSDFAKAIKLSPHSSHIYFNRGNLFSSLKDFDSAEADYTKALELQPDDALVLKRRADVRGKLSRKAEAVQDYQRAIQIQTMKRKK